MPISSLVVTFRSDPQVRQAALDRLAGDSRVTLGAGVDNRTPVVTETASVREARDLFREIETLEGVDFVALVSVDFCEDQPLGSEEN